MKPVDWPSAALNDGSTLYAEREIALTAGDGARVLVARLEADREASGDVWARIGLELASVEARDSVVAGLWESSAFELLGPLDALLRASLFVEGFVPLDSYRASSHAHHDSLAVRLTDAAYMADDEGGRVSPPMWAEAVALPRTEPSRVLDPPGVDGITVIAIAPEAAWSGYSETFATILESVEWAE